MEDLHEEILDAILRYCDKKSVSMMKISRYYASKLYIFVMKIIRN